MVRPTSSRSLVVGVIGAATAILLATASVAAAAPEHSKVTGFTDEFPAGTFCSFPVTVAAPDTNLNLIVFPVQDNGDQLVRSVGHGLVVVTNGDTGGSLTLRGGFRQDLLFHADGSADAFISGTILAGYGALDVGGPSLWWFRGHLHDALDSTFTATSHQFTGNATDLCAALAG